LDIYRTTRSLKRRDVERAYREAGFPMAVPEWKLITWHRPDPRAILPLDGFHVSRSLARTLRRGGFEVTHDRDFEAVMRACASGRDSTWITEEFIRVYGDLHREGKAHSVEVWADSRLAGGVYGLHLGGAFFAESMFHRATDMSKVALHALVARLGERGFALLEVQYLTPHLASLGAVEIPLEEYRRRLARALAMECAF
jgi:leucyl/phenylalanyl-tRNA--protein transferase